MHHRPYQRRRGAEAQRSRGAEAQRRRGAEAQRRRGAEAQRRRGAEEEMRKNAPLHDWRLSRSPFLPTGGNPKPIGGERKVQLIIRQECKINISIPPTPLKTAIGFEEFCKRSIFTYLMGSVMNLFMHIYLCSLGC